MAKVARIEYDKQELADILTTAVDGGMMNWFVFDAIERDPDLTITEIAISPIEETEGDFIPMKCKPSDLQWAIDRVTSGFVKLRSDLVESIRSGDAGNIDAEGAECLVQIACLNDLVYG